MERNQEKNGEQTAQITWILRLAAGVYLVYLAWGLWQESLTAWGGGQALQIGCAVLFFAVGLILGGWSLKKLFRKAG